MKMRRISDWGGTKSTSESDKSVWLEDTREANSAERVASLPRNVVHLWQSSHVVDKNPSKLPTILQKSGTLFPGVRDSAKFIILHGRWRRKIVAKKSSRPV